MVDHATGNVPRGTQFIFFWAKYAGQSAQISHARRAFLSWFRQDRRQSLRSVRLGGGWINHKRFLLPLLWSSFWCVLSYGYASSVEHVPGQTAAPATHP